MTATLVDLAALEQRHPRLKGLAGFWQKELAPALVPLETERRQAVRTFWLRLAGVLGGVALLTVLLLSKYSFSGAGQWVLVGAILGVTFGGAWAYAPLGKARKAAKAKLATAMCRFYKLDYSVDAAGFPMDDFLAAKFLPQHHKLRLEDGIAGQVEGVPLTLCDARLIRRTRKAKGGNQDTTVFQGLLLTTPLPDEPAAEPILLLPDWGRIGNFLASLGRRGRVTLAGADPEFERQYEVYSTDAAAAAKRLNPGLQRCLVALAAVNEKSPSLVLSGDRLLIALPRKKDSFEGVSAFKPFDQPAPLERMVADLDLLSAIVQALELPPVKTGVQSSA